MRTTTTPEREKVKEGQRDRKKGVDEQEWVSEKLQYSEWQRTNTLRSSFLRYSRITWYRTMTKYTVAFCSAVLMINFQLCLHTKCFRRYGNWRTHCETAISNLMHTSLFGGCFLLCVYIFWKHLCCALPFSSTKQHLVKQKLVHWICSRVKLVDTNIVHHKYSQPEATPSQNDLLICFLFCSVQCGRFSL